MSYMPPPPRRERTHDNPHSPAESPTAGRASPHAHWPRIGQTRCYWALLSQELEFIFLDPILGLHLAQQADGIIGKSLLDFVHPDEKDSARHDLAGVLESRTLHGSVTRVRYCRLSRVRKLLGFDGVLDIAEDVDINKIVYDDHYMTVDLVINLAAEGVVLCFLHAVVDITPQDNDEARKTNWTNWCGSRTGGITPGHYAVLYQRLRPTQSLNSLPPGRVFQILLNNSDRQILFSWPPEGFSAADYGRLAAEVQMPFDQGPGQAASDAHDNDAKTSCTRRYKAQQSITCTDGVVREVESIFIPYGCIIFACHKTVSSRPSAPSHILPPHSMAHSVHSAHSALPPPFFPGHGGYYESQHFDGIAARSMSGHASPASSHQYPSPYTPHSSMPPLPMAPSAVPSSQHHLGSSEHWGPSQPTTSGVGLLPSSHYAMQQHWPTHAPYPLDAAAARTPYSNAPSPQALPSLSPIDADPSSSSSTSSLMNEVPPARPRASRLSPGTPGAKEPAGRAGGNPPSGLQKCVNCKVKNSPEWRKGPSGKKDLCNACGLRFARNRAKKEGVTVQRRRKEKGSADTPPASGKSKKSSPSRSASAFPVSSIADERSPPDHSSASPTSGHASASGLNGLGMPNNGYQQQPLMMPSMPPAMTYGMNNLALPMQHGAPMGVSDITPSPSPPTPTHSRPNGHSAHGMDYYHHLPNLHQSVQYQGMHPGYGGMGRLPANGGHASPLPSSFERGERERQYEYDGNGTRGRGAGLRLDQRPAGDPYERNGKDREGERERLPPTPISAEPRRGHGHHAKEADAMFVHGQA